MKMTLKKLNMRGHTHIWLPVLVVLIIGAIGTYVGIKSFGHAATSTPYVQCTKGTANGRTSYTCGWSLPTPVLYSNGTSAGSFYLGSRNYIFCQAAGKTVYRGSYYNKWWGYTISDQGHNGWANAVYTTSGSNNYGFAYWTGSAWAKVPTCSTGTPPGGSTSGGGTATQPSSSSSYLAPIRTSNIYTGRYDQGVDFGGDGPVYAIGSGTLVHIYDTGWPSTVSGGVYMVYRLSNGPAAGKYVYVAENCRPRATLVSYFNAHNHTAPVTTNTVLCDAYTDATNNYAYNYGFETGWSLPPSTYVNYGNAAATDQYHNSNIPVHHNCVVVSGDPHSGGYVTNYGMNFAALMNKLRASWKASSSSHQSYSGNFVTLPSYCDKNPSGAYVSGYPTW